MTSRIFLVWINLISALVVSSSAFLLGDHVNSSTCSTFTCFTSISNAILTVPSVAALKLKLKMTSWPIEEGDLMKLDPDALIREARMLVHQNRAIKRWELEERERIKVDIDGASGVTLRAGGSTLPIEDATSLSRLMSGTLMITIDGKKVQVPPVPESQLPELRRLVSAATE